MDREAALKEFGLSAKETDVYTTLLQLGSTNLQEIAKRVDLPRTTIYNTLNYLAQKGLVSYVVKDHVRFYQATEPRKLVEKLQEKQDLIESVLPELEGLTKKSLHSSSVEMYEGRKGLVTISADVFSKKQQLYYFGSFALANKIIRNQPKRFRSMRIDRGIPAKIIIEKTDDEIYNTKAYRKLTQLRFHPAMKEFPCMIFIYGKKVAIHTVKRNLVGVIIDNEQVAQAMRMTFELLWKSAKRAW